MMKKLTLDVEALAVESFRTMEALEGGGTVLANVAPFAPTVELFCPTNLGCPPPKTTTA
jgi:hypothetical protein